MDIPDLLSRIRNCAPEFAMSYCIVNGCPNSLQEIQAMGFNEFSYQSKINMPKKLYKYFPNVEKDDGDSGVRRNYSIESLKNNTVFLQSPMEFDDVYDSDISISFSEFERLRLLEYCKRCDVQVDSERPLEENIDNFSKALENYYRENSNLNGVFSKTPDTEIEQLANQLYAERVTYLFLTTGNITYAVRKALYDECNDYFAYLKTTFRAACFTTTPYSQLMWGGAYADCHRGFCLEYTVLPNDNIYRDVYCNLFPMIYCKVRPDITAQLVDAKDEEFSDEKMWRIYFNGTLRKSIDWAFQNEWRLLLPMRSKNISDYNIRFFPITKVYLGNRMDKAKRTEIIDICHEKNIPYTGVQRNSTVYEMQDCIIKCEDCPQYKGLN